MISGQAAESGIETSVKEEGNVPSGDCRQRFAAVRVHKSLINSLEAMDGEGGSVEIKLSAEAVDRARSKLATREEA